MAHAVILLSGGLDSTTTLAIARSEGFDLHAISFAYGQRHQVEIDAAKRIAESFDVSNHMIVDCGFRWFGGSALTADIPVPKGRDVSEIGHGVPVTYVPARNTIFLSFALGWAEVIGAGDIFIGVNAVDYSGYPDCRPEYIAAYEAMANLATKATLETDKRIRIHTPIVNMTKADIIRTGLELGVDYSLTSSCYDPSPDGVACGTCDTCVLRLQGFDEAGTEDPIRYAIRDQVSV